MVEAAGNGAVNLDQTACGDFFNPSVQDSGAIIVGAGMPPGESDRSPESFTSYGSRVNVQGWGSNIVTTGYGDLYKNPSDETNPDFWYTQTFGGTSGASPMMTGAAADLQGISLSRGVLLTPGEIRSIFIETGSPQQGDMTRHIGPRPNLWLAVNQLANYSISGTVTDSKGSPLVGVSMVLGGAESATTLTAFDGTYYFSGLSNGDYTVTPGYSQCSFTPVSISVNINGAEVTGQNFTGTCTPSYSCRFTAKPASGKVPFTVKFKGSSTGISKVKSWLWNFGDETTGTSQNPSHTYESGGTYTVLLTVTGATPGVKATGIQKNCITVYETPMAGFTAAPLTGKAPLKVQFTDQSLGAAKWLWKFGDNQTSKEQNPVHTYRKAGRYTVGLTVTGPGGTNSMTKSGYITVTR
jgi:PKD repeat protein